MLVAGAMALALNSACYAFVPLSTGAPAVGTGLRVRLTRDGETEMVRYLGPRVVSAEGTLSAIGADGSLTLGVEMVQTSDGVRQPWSGEGVVVFPKAYVTDVQVRTLNRRQTTIATIALAASVILIAIIALAAGGAHGAPDAGGGTPP